MAWRRTDRGLYCFRDPKAQYLHRTVAPYFDVRRFEIAMNDSLLVRCFECIRDLLRDRQGFVEWNGSTLDALRQVGALDQFHHEGGEVGCFLEAIDGPDVRMVESREDFGFSLKARQTFRIGGHRGGQDLERDGPLEIDVNCTIDLSHATGANLASNFVDADAGARSEGQTVGL